MSREIKFRAWNELTKNMWKVASLKIEDEYVDLFKTNIYGETSWAKIADVELMQYTGLKDINDVGIYEGDIVKSQNGTGGRINTHIIEWNNFYTGFNPIRQDESDFNRESCEVIGNIYEHRVNQFCRVITTH